MTFDTKNQTNMFYKGNNKNKPFKLCLKINVIRITFHHLPDL